MSETPSGQPGNSSPAIHIDPLGFASLRTVTIDQATATTAGSDSAGLWIGGAGGGNARVVELTDSTFTTGQAASPAATDLEILNGGQVYGYYRTADDRWLAIGWLEPKIAMALFQAIEKPEWLPRASTLDAHALGELRQDVVGVIASRTRNEWAAVFEAVDGCVEPVLDLCEAHRHPQLQARRLFAMHRGEDGVETEQFTSPIRRTDGEA